MKYYFFINKYIIHKNNHDNILLHNSMYFSFLSTHAKNGFSKYSTIEHITKIAITLIMYALLINYYITH